MSKIHFLNVDEGDCSIIEHDNEHVTMIDICCGNIEGTIEKAFSSAMTTEGVKGNFRQKEHPNNPISYLKRIGVKSIFRYIQTHPDMDHMDGLDVLSKSFEIYNFWDIQNDKQQEFGENGKSGRYLKKDWDCYCKLRKSKDCPKALFYLDGASNKFFCEDNNGLKNDDYLKILSPTKALIDAANEQEDWNDCSYVILYVTHGFKILFCGDSDMGTLNHLIQDHKDDISNIDVLIAPHHGRDSDKDFAFWDIMKPRLTLMGNAKSKFLAYDEWNNRGLEHFTNNQVDNVLVEFDDSAMHVSISNKSFADRYCLQNWRNNSLENYWNDGYWHLFQIKK